MEKYKVIGVLIQALSNNNIFTGEIEWNKNNKTIEGKLTDCYGNSTIKGLMDLKESLEFEKKYENGDTTKYNFYFSICEDLWIGEYISETKYGETKCEIFNPSEQPEYDWERIAKYSTLSEKGYEKLTSLTLDNMKKKGYIDYEEDSGTGEKIVKLTKKGEEDLL